MSYEVDDERIRFIQSMEEQGYMNMGDGIEHCGKLSVKFAYFRKGVNGHSVEVR